MNIVIHPKENFYFGIKILFSLLFYFLIALMIFSAGALGFAEMFIFIFYFGIFVLYILFSHGILIGYLKGNAIRINDNQFPDIYTIAKEQAQSLELAEVPTIYILQAGGLLNAFATRFFGRNFIVLYSDILETAYEKGNKALEFVIAHEFGHIKRNHITKQLLTFPSRIIPFLNPAYSRACEYTCDNIGYSLCPEGAENGMLILAAGKRLYSKVNKDEFVNSSNREFGFWKWFAEIISSHPNLPKRITRFK